MPLGDIFQGDLTIRSGAEGTYIVHPHDNRFISDGAMKVSYGFSSITDLMAWLQRHADALKPESSVE